jgi:hypothetical protein
MENMKTWKPLQKTLKQKIIKNKKQNEEKER